MQNSTTIETAMQKMRKEIDDRIEKAKYTVVADELKVIRNIIDMRYLAMEKSDHILTFDTATDYAIFGIDKSGKEYFYTTYNMPKK